MSQIGIDSRSTHDLIQLALAAPEEDDDYLKERWHFVSWIQHRGNREVLDRALGLTKSSPNCPKDRWVSIFWESWAFQNEFFPIDV